MTGAALVAALVVLNTTVTLLLVVMVATRKITRDRRERRSEQGKNEFRNMLRDQPADLAASLRTVCSDKRHQVDLLFALREMPAAPDADWREPVRGAALIAGVERALARQTLSSDPTRRGLAALLLGQLTLPGAAELIEPLLGDDDGDVRISAAGALSGIADDAAARALVAALVRGVIAPERVVERLAGSWAVPTLLTALSSTQQPPTVRSWMARALGLAGDPRAEPTLLRMLIAGSDEERTSAARALGRCGSAASAAALGRALGDRCAAVRAQAATAVGSLGMDASGQALERCLADSSWWVRSNAATSLVSFGEPGLAALVRTLGSRDPYARARAAEALALSGLGPTGVAVTTGLAA